jgi:hypothetical protein
MENLFVNVKLQCEMMALNITHPLLSGFILHFCQERPKWYRFFQFFYLISVDKTTLSPTSVQIDLQFVDIDCYSCDVK